MATYNKFHQFVEDLAKKVHNLSSDSLKIYLTNATPDAAADEVKADLAEISGGNGYSAGGVTATILSCEQTSGTLKLILDGPFVITASGGSIGPFRYVVLYNDTPTSPADPLIAWWDYGSALTIQDGETFTITPDETAGVLTIA
jgi:hypothetical protein